MKKINIAELENQCRDAHRRVGILAGRGYPRGYKAARVAAEKAARKLAAALKK